MTSPHPCSWLSLKLRVCGVATRVSNNRRALTRLSLAHLFLAFRTLSLEKHPDIISSTCASATQVPLAEASTMWTIPQRATCNSSSAGATRPSACTSLQSNGVFDTIRVRKKGRHPLSEQAISPESLPNRFSPIFSTESLGNCSPIAARRRDR